MFSVFSFPSLNSSEFQVLAHETCSQSGLQNVGLVWNVSDILSVFCSRDLPCVE